MIHDILFLLIGLVLIIAGGNYLTDGAEGIARRVGLSPLMIGLTIVALGSSTPDLVVCVMSAARHKSELALGDVVGANIFDILLVGGMISAITPIRVSRLMSDKDLPMLGICSAALLFMCCTTFIDGGGSNSLDRSDSLVLLLFFGIYAATTIEMSRNPAIQSTPPTPGPTDWSKKEAETGANAARVRARLHLPRRSHHSPAPRREAPKWLDIVMILGGLGALVVGGNWIVDGASGIALKAGMSEAMVGLTIVAIGSSVPDLATSLIASLKGQPGIALGNIVGACIFNVLFVLPVSGCITPLECGHISIVDFAVMAGGSVLLWFTAVDSKRRVIGRGEGWLLMAMYAAYMAYLIIFRK